MSIDLTIRGGGQVVAFSLNWNTVSNFLFCFNVVFKFLQPGQLWLFEAARVDSWLAFCKPWFEHEAEEFDFEPVQNSRDPEGLQVTHSTPYFGIVHLPYIKKIITPWKYNKMIGKNFKALFTLQIRTEAIVWLESNEGHSSCPAPPFDELSFAASTNHSEIINHENYFPVLYVLKLQPE